MNRTSRGAGSPGAFVVRENSVKGNLTTRSNGRVGVSRPVQETARTAPRDAAADAQSLAAEAGLRHDTVRIPEAEG